MVEGTGIIRYEEEFVLNSRGLKLFTCRWLPPLKCLRALVFLCHGYGMECSIFLKGIGTTLAEEGYGVFGIEYEGHGKSDGLRAYIRDFNTIVDDCASFFKSIKEKKEYQKKPTYLFGESMGGAIALNIHFQEPHAWNGAILVAPMCKISENVTPHPIIVKLLIMLSSAIPTWKIVPTGDIISTAFKDPVKREKIRANPYIYQSRPRVKTAVELLYASMALERQLHKIAMPILILHGESDAVTDPAVSQSLYQMAESQDKTLKLYPGMWHGLLTGEPDHNVKLVFDDIISWLNDRNG